MAKEDAMTLTCVRVCQVCEDDWCDEGQRFCPDCLIVRVLLETTDHMPVGTPRWKFYPVPEAPKQNKKLPWSTKELAETLATAFAIVVVLGILFLIPAAFR